MYDVDIMLRKTVYFRDQDDLDKFNAIKNKAEWLHDHLDVDIMKNKIGSQEIFAVNRKPTGYYEAANPKFTEPTVTPPEEAL